MKKPRRWRKEFPYFKIQRFDEQFQSWKDQRGVFDTLEDAQREVARLAPLKVRIIVVEERARHPMPEPTKRDS